MAAKRDKETVRTVAGDNPASELESLADKLATESEAETVGETVPDTEPPRRKPGRPKGSKTRKRSTSGARSTVKEPELDTEPSAEELQAQLVQLTEQMTPLTYKLIAVVIDRKYPDQPYTVAEAAELTAAMLPVAAKYGSGLMQYTPELMLIAVMVSQFAGRSMPPGRNVSALPAPDNK